MDAGDDLTGTLARQPGGGGADRSPRAVASGAAIRRAGERRAYSAAAPERCRTNSRRGSTDPAKRSYPPVESVRRALEILRTVNRLRIASVSDIYEATRFPKPTIVRMLETLIADGYVARDNLCGGYRVTFHARELNSGFSGISLVIEAARPWVIELTRQIKWPIGIGAVEDGAVSGHFTTAAISPWAHSQSFLGQRMSLTTSAMGRAHLAFCPPEELEMLLAAKRNIKGEGQLTGEEEKRLRALLERIRKDGFATRDERTEPRRTSNVATPIRLHGEVLALVGIGFYRSAVPKEDIIGEIIAPLRQVTAKIEETIALIQDSGRDVSGRLPDWASAGEHALSPATRTAAVRIE